MQTGAHGKATHNSFRKDIGLPGKIEDVNSRASTLHNAITGKFKFLTDQELCEIHGADAFIQEEIKKIINHPIMQPDSPKGLTRRIFWQNSFKLALRGGEHHNLKIQKRKDGAEVISIPADNAVIRDYEIYFLVKDNQFVKMHFTCNHTTIMKIVEFMGYWLKYAQMGENREGISDNDVMSVSRLKNSYSLAYYERLKSQAQLNELNDDQQDQQNQEINGKDHQNRSPWKCFSEL
ncbi:unnamed protein product [Rhizophagus irregularis]|nr:unnamed protein product [Rhizophagus irregularis]